MNKIYSIFMMVILVSFSAMIAGKADANEKVYNFDGFTKMSGSEISSLFAGRTFWGKNQHDRFFFGKDGKFAQQFVKSGQVFKPGSTFYGQWNVDSDGAVCMSYQQSNVAQKLENQCFDVYMGPDKHKALPKYTDPLYLVKKGDTSKTKVEYFWSRWIDGRLIFDPTFAAQFEQNLSYIKSIDNKFDANRFKSTPPVKDLSALPEDAQNYHNAISGNVLFTPYHYLYFAPNGDYIFYERGEFEANKGSLEILKAKAKKGRWIIFNNVHCWSQYGDKPRTTCQMVAQSSTLDHPFEGFVSLLDDGFSRLLNGDPVGIMSPEQTGAAAAFVQ